MSEWTVEKLKEAKIEGTQDALKQLAHMCNRSGLDPIAKQIYAIKRGGRYSIETGIDGFRAIAEKSGQYLGSKIEWAEGNDGKPLSATATVTKVIGNVTGEFQHTVQWSEFGSNMHMWKKMPHQMLGKVAESHALRKAFPSLMSGLYTAEEMAQSDAPMKDGGAAAATSLASVAPNADAAVPPPSDAVVTNLKMLAETYGWEQDQKAHVWARFQAGELSADQIADATQGGTAALEVLFDAEEVSA